MAVLRLYSIYHLNLAYSSIPESSRKDVIRRCYWPLLHLTSEGSIPIAIEATAYTLEVVRKLDPEWLEALRRAVNDGKAEFVGAGYAQLIGPLVPASVNRWNLDIGRETYRALLGVEPKLWYINEQAYSQGIVEHYTRIGARAIIMEWNNPRTLHAEWKEALRHHPQVAIGSNGLQIPVIWNDSVSFQKFQRCAHGEIDVEEFATYLRSHVAGRSRSFCLYGNDAEIFDFRPGRFSTEPRMGHQPEWNRILNLYRYLRADQRFELVLPSSLLDKCRRAAHAFVPLMLESSAQPIPVKKQPKYNVTRWTVTGRDSLRLNTACYASLRKLTSTRGTVPLQLKKDLCYLWSSDFRTHITAERWEKLQKQLGALRRRLLPSQSHSGPGRGFATIRVKGLTGRLHRPAHTAAKRLRRVTGTEVSRQGRFIRIQTPSVDVLLNPSKGLAVERLLFPSASSEPLAGTVPHGYFNDIALSADWYTGITVLQRPGSPQVTDLRGAQVKFFSSGNAETGCIECRISIVTELGPILKTVRIYRAMPQVDLESVFSWKILPIGAFRTAFVTLIPESFDRNSLFYATHNGGSSFETFSLAGRQVAHGVPGSSVVSASSGLGATEGFLVIGDAGKALAIWVDQAVCAAMPMVTYREAAPSFFARVMFSCGEMDESRVAEVTGPLRFVCSVSALTADGHPLPSLSHRQAAM